MHHTCSESMKPMSLAQGEDHSLPRLHKVLQDQRRPCIPPGAAAQGEKIPMLHLWKDGFREGHD